MLEGRSIKQQIISNNDIDEEAAKAYLEKEKAIDLFPGISEHLSLSCVADILAVSEPTISRMIADGQIELNKISITKYCKEHYLVLRPVLEVE